MKNPTLTQIQIAVESSGGTYKKSHDLLNDRNLYWVNDILYSQSDLVKAYKAGQLA
jgi:hypothetical protein